MSPSILSYDAKGIGFAAACFLVRCYPFISYYLSVSLEGTMPEGYLFLLGFAALATLFPLLALAVGRYLRPSKPSVAKLDPYECGILPESDARGRYSVRFYIVAMLFVVFDVETVLLFPWAVRYKQMGWFGLGEAGVFLAFLVVGYIWILRKGALDWF